MNVRFLFTHKRLRHVQVYQGICLYKCTWCQRSVIELANKGMPLTLQLKPSRFFDLTQDSFCSRNENDFAKSKTADFRSGIFLGLILCEIENEKRRFSFSNYVFDLA